MTTRLRGLGIALAVIGIVFVAAGAFAFIKAQEGTSSLNAFSAAQNVKLSYNEDGQLTDRGETAGAQAIMSLLKDDWKYPVAEGDLNPNDPLVNTASEYMYQMATVAYHTLNSTQTIVLDEPVEYKGETFAAGEYEFAVDGRYWADFDRQHPIEGPARAQAWTGTAHALIAELGVGTATASALQLALALAGLFAGVGATVFLTGIGLVWATRAETVPVPVLRPAGLTA
ncbi:MAG TPA: hypothetical protein VFM19_02035 [Candidatus Limnocylindria bacterium]|nr:hypothetical protein [Candidatus Limnocylindria bacterium]